MTCASCSANIVKALSAKDWVSNVAVNLATNTATVDFTDKKRLSQIVEAIEDLGYDAHLQSDEVLGACGPQGDGTNIRIVELRIDGFHCGLCPGRAISSLFSLQSQGLRVLSRPTKDNPYMRISYIPGAQYPNLNIRQILAAINTADSAFEATVHRPDIQAKSKAIHARYQKKVIARLLMTIIVAIPTFVIGVVYMSLIPSSSSSRQYIMSPLTAGVSRAQIALFILATPVYFFAADLFHSRAIKELWTLWKPGSRTPFLQRFYRFGSMNMLMSLGTSIAYISSFGQLVAAASQPGNEIFEDSKFYFDSVVFLTLFLLSGRLIEAYSKAKTGDAIEKLGKLRPTMAILVEGSSSSSSAEQGHSDSAGSTLVPSTGHTRSRPIDVNLLDEGDVVSIPHGASPPYDGIVIYGASEFDESSLTGEARLVKKSKGDKVYAGTVNEGLPIQIEITDASGQSMLDQIIKVVREGQTKRAPVEKVADMLTAYFVPVITLLAVLTWVIWAIIGATGAISPELMGSPGRGWVTFALQFAIAVFVVACPCGLGLAAPTAIYVGGGLAASHGILAKGGGDAFEKASRIDCVVFDKTGTLTEGGQPTITNYEYYLENNDEMQHHLLSVVRAIEQNSSHPMAKAIATFCGLKEEQTDVSISSVEEVPGKGMVAQFIDPHSELPVDIIIGNDVLMSDFNVPTNIKATISTDGWKMEAKSIALVAIKTALSQSYQIAATLAMSDPIRPAAGPVIAALKEKGVDVWMLSGDNKTTARAVARAVGIPESNVIASVLPTQKSAKIEYLQFTLKAGVSESTTQRAIIGMIGDGINDAPALTMADVGIAVGSGSDIAISSADFVLVNSDLRNLVTLLELSETVFRRIKFNFGWALVYNLVALPFAAGCFYAVHISLDPVWASLAMALSSISVVLSSLALRTKLPVLGFRAQEIPIGEV
ncbi:E1-E2 ATPase-domain-containing protein [Xylariales sp. PMI_506]|nr:E1-E2 ATPase-domain-containing protein [Xylariales sp. PMI_506]